MATSLHAIEADLREFKSDWLRRGLAKETLKHYERHLRRYFGHATTLDLLEARGYVDGFESKNEGRYAARALKAFAKWYAGEYETANPLPPTRFKLPKEPKPGATRIATAADADAILAVCKGDGSERFLALRDHAMVSVLACTGVRRGELHRMALADWDETTGAIVLPKTKNGDRRVVRLSEDAAKSVRRYRRQCEVLLDPAPLWLTQTMGRLSSDAIRKAIERRTKQAGLDVTAHSFRRGFAVEWLKRGGSETYLKTIAGWKTSAMIGRYVESLAESEALDEHRKLFG